MTIIELIVVLLIVTMALVVGAIALGGITGAKTREGAGKLATAVRYTYNLAAINNKVYALYIDLSNNSYRAAPIKVSGECDRVLLALDGKDSGAVVRAFGKKDGEDDEDSESEPGLFDAAMGSGGGEAEIPGWASQSGSTSSKFASKLSEEARSEARNIQESVGVQSTEDSSDVEGQRKSKKLKSFRMNMLGESRKLPEGVEFAGVVVRDGEEPVIEGTVPIVFYPHGFTQRAIIHLKSKGDDDDVEKFSVEIKTLQGRGVVHEGWMDPGDFKEETH